MKQLVENEWIDELERKILLIDFYDNVRWNNHL